MKWYQDAAQLGLTQAQFELGVAYESGKGTQKNYSEALKWLKLAGDNNYPQAQLLLGIMYNEGEGVPQDYIQAYKWFNLSSANFSQSDNENTTLALQNRDRVAEKMTPEQIAKGQELSNMTLQKTATVEDPGDDIRQNEIEQKQKEIEQRQIELETKVNNDEVWEPTLEEERQDISR